jgi:hypothetical protein
LIRRVVLWAWRDSAAADERLRAKEGLAYIRYGSHSIDTLDFGEDLGIGSPANFDLALERDHRNRARWDEYNQDPHHDRVGALIDTLTWMERTARIDWLYDGPPSSRGLVRHIALYRWRDGVDDAARAHTLDAVRSLRTAAPSVRSLHVGCGLRWGTNHHDWVVEAHFEDEAAWREFAGHPRRQAVRSRVDLVTEPDQTAQIEHRMLSG